MDIIVAGWMFKKKQEGKSSLLGNKYQKRWFELTDDSLAYAKDPNELKETNIEVFSMPELKWFKRLGELKIEMQFPERVLRLKAVSPGEADRWYKAIERLQVERLQSCPTSPAAQESYMPLEPKKPQIATAFTIEADSDSDDDRPIPAVSAHRQSAASKPSVAGSQHSSVHSQPSVKRGGPLPVLQVQVPEDNMVAGGGQNSNRPPSPRSLLANPRLGGIMVSTPTKRQVTADWNDETTGGSDNGVRLSHDTPDSSQASPGRTNQLLTTQGSAKREPPSAPLDLPRPAHLNTSLRANVLIQDETAAALRSPSGGSSTGANSPLNQSLLLNASLGAPGGLNSSSLNPLNSSLNGSRAGTPGRRTPVASAREEVVMLVPSHDDPQRVSGGSSGAAATSRLAGGGAAAGGGGGRPGSGAAAAVAAAQRLAGPQRSGGYDAAGDERLELAPPPPRTPGSRLNSAGNSVASGQMLHGGGGGGGGSRLNSAGNSNNNHQHFQQGGSYSNGAAGGRVQSGSSTGHGGATGSAMLQQAGGSVQGGTENGDEGWVEEDWDSSDVEEDDDSAMGKKHQQQHQRGGGGGGAQQGGGRGAGRDGSGSSPLPPRSPVKAVARQSYEEGGRTQGSARGSYEEGGRTQGSARGSYEEGGMVPTARAGRTQHQQVVQQEAQQQQLDSSWDEPEEPGPQDGGRGRGGKAGAVHQQQQRSPLKTQTGPSQQQQQQLRNLADSDELQEEMQGGSGHHAAKHGGAGAGAGQPQDADANWVDDDWDEEE